MSSESPDLLPVAKDWFAIEDCGAGVSRIYEPAVHPLIQGNAFFLKGRDCDLLVDACCGIASLREALERAGLIDKQVVAVATHAHYDHVGSLHEFERRLIHEAEADELVHPVEAPTLLASQSDPDFIAAVERAGMDVPELLLSALPSPGYEPATYSFPTVPHTGLLREGDRVELGDRSLEVLHLPGHSPGSIGLFERGSGILFAGDLVYDDILIAEGPGTDMTDYLASMRRLEGLEVSSVHGGHGPSFSRERMLEFVHGFIDQHDPAPG